MKNVSSLKVGDTAIYIGDYEIKDGVVTECKYGSNHGSRLVLLENGDYLFNDSKVFESDEEAKECLKKNILSEIMRYENEREIVDGMIDMLKMKLEQVVKS